MDDIILGVFGEQQLYLQKDYNIVAFDYIRTDTRQFVGL
jgi:hypothetical protein